MKSETIKKTIAINAPKEKVWAVLFDDNYTRAWYVEFGEGSKAETDWKIDSKALFTDNSGSGLIGKVIVNRPTEVLSLEYQGIVNDGKEDYSSPIAKSVKGGRETYRLTEKVGITHLAIECDMEESMFESMAIAWEKALLKIKELSEK